MKPPMKDSGRLQSLDPQFHQAHYNAGWTAEQISRNADAERHYRNAYDIQQSTDYLALADTLTKNDKSAESVELYKSYLSNNDDKSIRYKLIEAMTSLLSMMMPFSKFNRSTH